MSFILISKVVSYLEHRWVKVYSLETMLARWRASSVGRRASCRRWQPECASCRSRVEAGHSISSWRRLRQENLTSVWLLQQWRSYLGQDGDVRTDIWKLSPGLHTCSVAFAGLYLHTRMFAHSYTLRHHPNACTRHSDGDGGAVVLLSRHSLLETWKGLYDGDVCLIHSALW